MPPRALDANPWLQVEDHYALCSEVKICSTARAAFEEEAAKLADIKADLFRVVMAAQTKDFI